MDFTPIGIFSTPTGVFFFLWQQILHLPHYCTCLFNESYGFNTVTKFISNTGTAGNHVKLTSALYKILKSSGGWTESQQWPSQQKQLLTPLQVTWPILRSQWCARKTLFTYFTQPVKTCFFRMKKQRLYYQLTLKLVISSGKELFQRYLYLHLVWQTKAIN